MWLSGFSASLQTKRSTDSRESVRFPLRAHAWVLGQCPSWGHARGKQSVYLSHSDRSPFLPLALKISKKIFLNKRKLKNYKLENNVPLLSQNRYMQDVENL